MTIVTPNTLHVQMAKSAIVYVQVANPNQI